ncbi:DUF960 family protein [Oceanobacillus massiliensis]|uniref:DUF960 family protein n=1 Tax=Oceanobacillus massiliensis TaxID=1465765 RepID=UPI00301837B7
MKFEKDKPRYETKQIASKVSIEIQMLLWKLIDSRNDRGETLDYLQVFELQKSDDSQIILNRQEQPPMIKTMNLRLKKTAPMETTIWIIDDGSQCTMLFPDDY